VGSLLTLGWEHTALVACVTAWWPPACAQDGDGALASRWACLVYGGRRVRAAVVSDAGRAAGLMMLGPDRVTLQYFCFTRVVLQSGRTVNCTQDVAVRVAMGYQGIHGRLQNTPAEVWRTAHSVQRGASSSHVHGNV
jgi:hypothetical protein